jgi:hypothetical protein
MELVRLMTEREDKKDAKMERQRKEIEAMIQAQRDEARADRAEMESKMAALKDELTPAPAPAAVSEEQLTALQARFEGLHATKLIADEVRTHASWVPRSCAPVPLNGSFVAALLLATNVPYSHSDKVAGGSVPGILSVHIVR